MTKAHDRAFPNPHVNRSKDDRDPDSRGWHGCGGMTLREYYAIRVMHSLISRDSHGDTFRHGTDYLVKTSVSIADDLIRELNK